MFHVCLRRMCMWICIFCWMVCSIGCVKSSWLIVLSVSYIFIDMLLLLLSHFSRVRLCSTPQTAAHQAPPSLGFSRQEHWSGLPFPSPMHESGKGKWSCSVMSDPQRPHGLHAAYQAPPSMGFSRQEYWSGERIFFSCFVKVQKTVGLHCTLKQNGGPEMLF